MSYPYGPPGADVGHLSQPPARQISTNGFAIVSLVLGILWLWWIGSILALVFGYVALRQIRRSEGWQQGRGIAIAGVVLGWVGAATAVLAVIVVAVVANEDDDSSNGLDAVEQDGAVAQEGDELTGDGPPPDVHAEPETTLPDVEWTPESVSLAIEQRGGQAEVLDYSDFFCEPASIAPEAVISPAIDTGPPNLDAVLVYGSPDQAQSELDRRQALSTSCSSEFDVGTKSVRGFGQLSDDPLVVSGEFLFSGVSDWHGPLLTLTYRSGNALVEVSGGYGVTDVAQALAAATDVQATFPLT